MHTGDFICFPFNNPAVIAMKIKYDMAHPVPRKP